MQSIIKKMVWICLAIIPFIALYVANGGTIDILSQGGAGLFFPFISGKNFVFRFLVEIAFAGWILLALKDRAYRINLKKSPLTVAYLIFMVVILIADIFGVDQMKSIWSNYERMEGFVGHIHLFAYFIILSAMLPTLKDWQKMFKVFIAADILVLISAYGQLLGAKGYIFSATFPKIAEWFSAKFPIHMSENRLDATIGNSAYFAIFCLMSACIAGLLWSQSHEPKRAKFYPLVIVLNLIALFYSGTRGTMIGLLVGVVITLALIAWHERGKARMIFAGVLIAMFVVVGSIFAFKDSNFIKSSPTLARLSSISPTDLTTSSRLYIWKISYEAWLERPILGYGQDNFSYIFARKFIPDKMWNLEPWYDRSHDVFFDWLVAGGILGLLSYLSLYFVALWLMWRRGHDMPLREKAILTGVIAGYFVHNIFVFDNLTSYIMFFALLAYIAMRTNVAHTSVVHHEKSGISDEMMKLLWAPLVGILLLVVLYNVNYRPLQVNRLLIDGITINKHLQTMSFADAVKLMQTSFTEAIAFNTLGTGESREQFLQMGVKISQVTVPNDVPPSDKQLAVQAINNFITAVRDDVTASFPTHKDDIRMLSIYGSFYNGIGDAVSAENILTSAHKIAPNKQLISFDLIRAYLMQRKYPEAYAVARETYDSEPKYGDAQKWYLISGAYVNQFKEAKKHVEENGGTISFDNDVLTALVNTGQTGAAIEMLIALKKEKPEYGDQVDTFIKQMLANPRK